MSPASVLLKSLRLSRNMTQYGAAHALGYETSLISQIESGHKQIPRQEFTKRLIQALDLSELEITEFNSAMNVSKHRFKLSLKLSHKRFYVVNTLINHIESLSDKQLQLINLVLSMNEENLSGCDKTTNSPEGRKTNAGTSQSSISLLFS